MSIIETVQAEELAHWYLRLNGFFTIPNFVVHPDSGSNQKTEIDVLGVRFPFRQELPGMEDDDFIEKCGERVENDDFIEKCGERPLVVVAEVKSSQCSLNRTWRDSENDALRRVLQAAGMLPQQDVQDAAKQLQEFGQYRSEHYCVSFVALGSSTDPDLAKTFPKMPQIMWSEVLTFVYERFSTFYHQKRSHPQWPKVGQKLWKFFDQSRAVKDFVSQFDVVENIVEPDSAAGVSA